MAEDVCSSPPVTKITTSCWTTIDRRMLEPTKTKYPMSKTKKKLQRGGRRGIIMIKSNLIPAVWVTHKLENNNTKEVLPLLWRFWPLHEASQPGDLTNGLGIPRESDLEGQRDLITKLPQDWGKQRLLEVTTKCAHQDPGERTSDPTRNWAKPACEGLRVSCRGMSWQ